MDYNRRPGQITAREPSGSDQIRAEIDHNLTELVRMITQIERMASVIVRAQPWSQNQLMDVINTCREAYDTSYMYYEASRNATQLRTLRRLLNLSRRDLQYVMGVNEVISSLYSMVTA